ncbi:MAG: flagellar M-ring protein FliF, partial [Gammaproteobacteria bacterium]|nr:flagellar M-ring protein FliF [Gammaproteobacteria bacterium]
RRGLEGELARTIASLRNVRSARVHLAIPKQSVFVRDARKPTASVFVDVLAGRRLGEEQIEAIVNLVASSVPEMNKGDVTVVDQKGNLLSRNGENTRARVAAEQFEYNRKVEDTLNTRVAGILESVVGAGRFRAEVTAELDFSAVEQAEELYNPDQQAVRSEQILNEQRVAGADGGIPGALSNQPPGEATVPEVVNNQQGQGGAATDMRDLRKQTVRNFEVDRTVSYTRQDQGRMRRLTVAVAVDDLRRVDPETGKLTYVPWPQEELQRLTLLVRDAVGYSAARGDSVTVVNTPFALPEEQIFEEPQFWEQPWFWDLMKQVLAGLAILVLVLGLLRPTLRNLSSTAERERDKALAGDEDGLEGLDRLESDSVLRGAIEGGSEFLLPSASEGYDRQLNALKGLIAEDPARVAQVVRQWVNADE